MAKIKIISECPLYDGMPVTFQAPCDCTAVDGLNVYYGDEAQTFVFRDAHCNDLTGIGNLFAQGAYVKAILNTQTGCAYLQNADTNEYLESKLRNRFAPQLVAVVPTGSTMTCTKGDTVLSGVAENNRVAVNVTEYGDWEANITTDGKTLTLPVDVSEVKQHFLPANPYFYGDECVKATGGWEAVGLGINATYNTAVAPVITRNLDNLTAKQVNPVVGGKYDCGVVKTVNKIPMKTVNYIHFDVEAYGSGNGMVGLVAMNKVEDNVEKSSLVSKDLMAYSPGPVSGVFTVDVRSITEDCYIGFFIYLDNTVVVNRIWLE